MDDMLLRARLLMEAAHEGQVDKAGEPYRKHPLAVSSRCTDIRAKTAALLHDVLEDTAVTEAALRDAFPAEIVDAVCLLTHGDAEDYFDYVRRVKENPIAREVKIADLLHNSDLSRLPGIALQDAVRLEKYAKALQILLA